MKDVRLVFADGRTFKGRCFTETGADIFGEVVFNTAMSGYQEVLTDPSYSGQIVLMTYPLIGNYGINTEDFESSKIHLKAMLVREYCHHPSNWRMNQTLKEYLDANSILGVENLDTRAITKYVRDNGAQKALLTCSEDTTETLVKKLQQVSEMTGQNLVKNVSTSAPSERVASTQQSDQKSYRIAVIDCGIKENILRQLSAQGCQCTVFPFTVSDQELLNGGFDGVFVSNGPGDPEPVSQTIQTIRNILGKIPLFGICLGHQLLALALGGQTYKLKFGHHGINHPVKNIDSGQIEISSQNHGFCVEKESLNLDDVQITHVNLNDQSVAGIRHRKWPAFSVQYHPEAGPGPRDSHYLFPEFVQMIDNFSQKSSG